MTLVNQVLVRSIAGNFNELGTRALFEEFKQKAPRDQHWASLAHAGFWEMSSQEALRAYNPMRDWAMANGCKKIALIYPSSLHLHIIEKQTGVVATEDFYPCRTLQQAAEWLSANGFPFSEADFPHHEFLEQAGKAQRLPLRNQNGTKF